VERHDVAIVGGGPSGAALAIGLAGRGHDVVIIERAPEPHWRACGVFSSPASIAALGALGVDDATLDKLTRRLPAMRVETASGTRFRLTYGDDGSLGSAARAFDRPALDAALLDLARAAGTTVRVGTTVLGLRDGRLALAGTSGETEVEARVVVGADGIRSVVARSVGVVRPAWLGDRVGLTFHVADPRPDETRDARMILFRGGYAGLAPVPDGRVNVGIVLAGRQSARLRAAGAADAVEAVLAAIPHTDDDPIDWPAARPADPIKGAAPVGHRVSRRHGRGWLLIGDAAGFLDPFTGEGLHRALVSARLGAAAIDGWLGGDQDALAAYDRAMTGRFRSKDAVSLVVQAFLGQPRVFEHAARRLAARADVRETMGLVMGDLVPASRALDPRYVAALLRP
jgi:flavin-dependent dehydrogenase